MGNLPGKYRPGSAQGEKENGAATRPAKTCLQFQKSGLIVTHVQMIVTRDFQLSHPFYFGPDRRKVLPPAGETGPITQAGNHGFRSIFSGGDFRKNSRKITPHAGVGVGRPAEVAQASKLNLSCFGSCLQPPGLVKPDRFLPDILAQ